MSFYSNSTKPKILLTNDDGIDAPGIVALAKELKTNYEHEFDVRVSAPSEERSGQSHAITCFTPLYVRDYSSCFQVPDVKALKVYGTPADCVSIVMSTDEFDDGWKPDLVVSGINRGANGGSVTMYSGTIGGAREANIHHIPSIATSLQHPSDSFPHVPSTVDLSKTSGLSGDQPPQPAPTKPQRIWRWDKAAESTVEVIRKLVQTENYKKTFQSTVLNVNHPNVDFNLAHYKEFHPDNSKEDGYKDGTLLWKVCETGGAGLDGKYAKVDISEEEKEKLNQRDLENKKGKKSNDEGSGCQIRKYRALPPSKWENLVNPEGEIECLHKNFKTLSVLPLIHHDQSYQLIVDVVKGWGLEKQ